MKRKLKIGVIFGGRSAEHEVSLVSAQSVINALDKKKYDIIPIGITLSGRWISSNNAIKILKNRKKLENNNEKILIPDPNIKGLVTLFSKKLKIEKIDVVFPVLHGTFGEDGTLQGLLELADIPYVGAGVLASAVAMDKITAHKLLKFSKIPVVEKIWFLYRNFITQKKSILQNIEKKLGYPCFIKPSKLGSSVGITKAHNRKELVNGIELASKYDTKILIEKAVKKAREIEVSVLGNHQPIVSIPGEVIPSNEFYDYDAKYVDGKSKIEIPAKLPNKIIKKIQHYAIMGYQALDCSGMARVDFLVEKDTLKIYLNELNTIPGFTSISMYPKLWEASGLPYSKLLDKLIELSIERYNEKKKLKTIYKPKAEWYK
ncbi:MAG: D-alanine--D-alanine ligase [Ignavibacteriae bacterium]|nr:MAG: D-alanine--D-alanine ligase [Ignavibacteriota bacterium]